MKLISKLIRNERGNALLETALIFPVLTMFGIGSFAVGVNFDRYLQVRNVARSAGLLASQGVNLATTANQAVLRQSTRGMNLSATSGNTIIYVSRVVKNGWGVPVVAQQFRIGKLSVARSSVANPTLVDAAGNVINYATDPAARATLPAGVSLNYVPEVFLAEMYHSTAGLSFPGFLSVPRMSGKAIF